MGTWASYRPHRLDATTVCPLLEYDFPIVAKVTLKEVKEQL